MEWFKFWMILTFLQLFFYFDLWFDFSFRFFSFLIGCDFLFFYFDYCCGGHREKQIRGQRFPQIQFSIDNNSLSRESTENLDLIVFCLRKISQIWVFNNLWIFNQVEPPPGVNIWSVNRWSTFRGKPISRLFGRDRRWIYYKSLPFLRIFPP